MGLLQEPARPHGDTDEGGETNINAIIKRGWIFGVWMKRRHTQTDFDRRVTDEGRIQTDRQTDGCINNKALKFHSGVMDTGVIGTDWDLHCARDRHIKSFLCQHVTRRLLVSQVVFIMTITSTLIVWSSLCLRFLLFHAQVVAFIPLSLCVCSVCVSRDVRCCSVQPHSDSPVPSVTGLDTQTRCNTHYKIQCRRVRMEAWLQITGTYNEQVKGQRVKVSCQQIKPNVPLTLIWEEGGWFLRCTRTLCVFVCVSFVRRYICETWSWGN